MTKGIEARVLGLTVSENQTIREVANEAYAELHIRQRRAEAAEAERDRLRDLLGRYARHVNCEEGKDFLDFGGDYLTEDECDEILAYAHASRPRLNTPD